MARQALAADGAQVPVNVLHARTTQLDGSAPMLLLHTEMAGGRCRLRHGPPATKNDPNPNERSAAIE